MDAKEKYKQWYFKTAVKISPVHRQKRIFMHDISREYSNQQIFQFSKKYKNFKRIKELTTNTM
jgi:hypothetical protein